MDFNFGDEVVFTCGKEHKAFPEFYPSVGTVGEVVDILDNGVIEVQWPDGSTDYPFCWACASSHVEIKNHEDN